MWLPNPLSTRSGRLAAFFMLYVTEGIPLGFTATAIATQMRRQGLGPAQIGVFVGTLYLPWAWKWVMGPVVDVLHVRRLGPRRGWILGAQLGMSLGLLALMPINFVEQLKLFTAAVVIINLFGATQDVAIDALACNVLRPEERGLANGVMFAGAYIGQAIGGSGVLLLSAHIDFNMTFFLVAASILAVTLLVVLPMREPLGEPAAIAGSRLHHIAVRTRAYLLDAGRAFFGTRAARAGMVFALLPAGSYALSLALASALAVELGLDDRRYGLLTLTTTIISAAGCVVGGFLSDRFGRRRMLAIYLAATALPTLYLAYLMQQHGWILPRDPATLDPASVSRTLVLGFWSASIVFAVFQGLSYGTKMALFMDICTPAVAATQFTAYMALLNVVIWYSATWQGWAAERIGYPATLAVDAVLGLVSLLALPFITTRRGNPVGVCCVDTASGDVAGVDHAPERSPQD